MRITRETLIRVAKETALKRALPDRSLVAAYLTGSVLTEEPFLGNTTDIDIVLVHADEPVVPREILAVTPEVHLDIRHNRRGDYDKPKELRVHPDLGPELYDPMPLYVTQHFFEYVQAGVRDKYHEPASVLVRARREAEFARQVWAGLQVEGSSVPERMSAYLNGVNLAANAVALLNDGLLAERRLLLQFPQRANAAGDARLSPALLDLLGGGQIGAGEIGALLPDWEKAFTEAAGKPHPDVRISLPRLQYYKQAFQALLQGEFPQAVLWPLLLTWTLAVRVLPSTRLNPWLSACNQLGLSMEAFHQHVDGLDAFLDRVDELLDHFAADNQL